MEEEQLIKFFPVTVSIAFYYAFIGFPFNVGLFMYFGDWFTLRGSLLVLALIHLEHVALSISSTFEFGSVESRCWIKERLIDTAVIVAVSVCLLCIPYQIEWFKWPSYLFSLLYLMGSPIMCVHRMQLRMWAGENKPLPRALMFAMMMSSPVSLPCYLFSFVMDGVSIIRHLYCQ
jgi:hypothetical protein